MARPPRLLDANGRSVTRKALTTPQATSGMIGVRQVFTDSVASGLTPSRLASILRACDAGVMHDYMVLAEEMEERDPHYASVLGVRKRAVSGVAPVVTAASESAQDKKIAEAVREHIAEHDKFEGLVEDLLDGLGKGFSVVEIHWDETTTPWSFHKFDWITQRHFQFDQDTGQVLRLIDEADPLNGVALRPHGFLVHRPRIKSGHIARNGLARLVAFGWMCKHYALKDWMAFAETYGLPLRIGKYGPGATAEDVDKLYTAVANIGSDAAAVLPESMTIEFEQVTGTQSEAVFEKLARFVDEQVSKAVLGQTMTSDNGSSQAQAKVHNEVRHDVAQADARAVAGTINRDLVRPFVDWNFGVQDSYPRIEIIVKEPEDLKLVLDATEKLIGRGLKVKASEVRARLGYSDPDEDDEIIGGGPSVPDPSTAAEANSREDPAPGPDPFALIDEIEGEMLGGWQPVMDETLRPLLARIAGASSLAEVLEILDEVRDLPSARLVEELVIGAVKARAIGDALDA